MYKDEHSLFFMYRTMRSSSRFGNFRQPHLRHEMSVNVSKDIVWYAAARANPRTHLPRFFAYIEKEHRRNFASQV